MSSEYPSGRTAKGYAQILGAARAAASSARHTAVNSIVRKAERDEIVFLPLNDATMSAALRSARETLPGFLALAKHPGPTMEGFAVKIALLARDGPEYFWIHPFAHVDERFIGQINNTPRSVVNLKMGETVTFTEDEIMDWMYVDAGTMRGNYSAQAILKSALPQDRKAFKRRFGLDFDF
jgi:uncharacterized protein YegJ (DUF2314 family)